MEKYYSNRNNLNINILQDLNWKHKGLNVVVSDIEQKISDFVWLIYNYLGLIGLEWKTGAIDATHNKTLDNNTRWSV